MLFRDQSVAGKSTGLPQPDLSEIHEALGDLQQLERSAMLEVGPGSPARSRFRANIPQLFWAYGTQTTIAIVHGRCCAAVARRRRGK